MADKKPSGFRFRLPWLQQERTPIPAPDPSTQSPRTQRPPFQPPKETQTTTKTIPTIETVGPTTPPQTPPKEPQSQQPRPPKSPPQFQLPSLPVSPTRIRTPPEANSQPRSPSRMATSPSDPEASPSRSTPEIKRSTEITKVKGTQTKTMNIPHSVETKSQKPKPISTSTRVALPREIRDDISKFIHKIATTSTSNQSRNEQPASVITIAGDNKGAFMHLNSDALKRDIKQDSKLDENEETKTIVNSNIQGINNSMMFDSSVTERNPGVHLVITQNLDAKMKNVASMEMQRAESNISPPHKVIYDPTIGISMKEDYEPDDFETYADSFEIEVL